MRVEGPSSMHSVGSQSLPTTQGAEDDKANELAR